MHRYFVHLRCIDELCALGGLSTLTTLECFNGYGMCKGQRGCCRLVVEVLVVLVGCEVVVVVVVGTAGWL